jgi:hypothetical protein
MAQNRNAQFLVAIANVITTRFSEYRRKVVALRSGRVCGTAGLPGLDFAPLLSIFALDASEA